MASLVTPTSYLVQTVQHCSDLYSIQLSLSLLNVMVFTGLPVTHVLLDAFCTTRLQIDFARS